VTYEIVCSKGLDAGKTALVKAFLTHLAGPDVQAGLEEIGYAPVPEEVLTKVRAAVEAIA
jgi:phosphate transport system substrate-binding protein